MQKIFKYKKAYIYTHTYIQMYTHFLKRQGYFMFNYDYYWKLIHDKTSVIRKTGKEWPN